VFCNRSEGDLSAIRLALAGGFDGHPPTHHPQKARIIPFPLDRRREAQGDAPVARHPPPGFMVTRAGAEAGDPA
jgi:hypothetical protein